MSKVIYTKIAKERRRQFQISTKILDCGDKKKVIKEALYEEGKKHLEHMSQYANLFEFDEVKPIECVMEKGRAIFPFINGKPLTDLLISMIESGDKTKVTQMLLDYKSIVYRLGCEEKHFESCKEFEDVFGVVEGLDQKLSGKYVNIDNILENILYAEKKYVMIDYEWYFDFYIPFDFVLFRATLDLFTNYNDVMQEMFEFSEVLELFGIEEELVSTYYHMNEKFNDYVFDDERGYNHNKSKYTKHSLSIEKYMQKANVYAQIYYDKGTGFSEENSAVKYISLIDYNESNTCTLQWDFPADVEIQRLRFDPINVSGYVEILNIKVLDKEKRELSFEVEDEKSQHINYLRAKLYLSNDPQIIIKMKEPGIRFFSVEMRVCPCIDSELNHQMNNVNSYIEHLKYNNGELQKYISGLIQNGVKDE